MQNVVIGNATYLVNRVFVGERKITDLIQKRIEENRLALVEAGSQKHRCGAYDRFDLRAYDRCA